MKKILSIIAMLIFVLPIQAQEQAIRVLKTSDTISMKTIIVPDYTYNDRYNKDDNDMAIIKGHYDLSTRVKYKYDGFYTQKFSVTNRLVYKPGKKVYPESKEKELGDKYIDWITIIIVFLYFDIFSFLFLKYKEKVLATAAAAAIAAIAIAIASAPESAVMASIVALIVAVVVLVVALVEENDKFFVIFSIASLIGMSIIWCFGTPVFFVSTLAGIICSYILFKITEKKKEEVV